jgi:hypothetical protein
VVNHPAGVMCRTFRTAIFGHMAERYDVNAMAMKGEEPKLTMLAPKWSLEEVARHAVDA